MALTETPIRPAGAHEVSAAGGGMASRVRELDWSETPLGPIERWPQSLKTAAQIALGSLYPMFIWWGRELILLYNDAYAPVLGQRHPAALGRPAPKVWADIWDVLEPQAQQVLQDGRATWNEERLLVLERNLFLEETYHTFSYSPILDDTGGVGGIFCAVTEDTVRVLGRRRLRTLRELGSRTTEEARTAGHACAAAVATLCDNPHDVPFAAIYLLDPKGERAVLAAAGSLGPESPARPATIAMTGSDGPWPLAEALRTGRGLLVDLWPGSFGALPGGAWPEAPRQAKVLPIAKPGQPTPAGYLVAGISPRLAYNDDYRGFLELAAGHIATAVAKARAFEEAKSRSEALAELDRAKTAFFANVSHELRTPLTLMLGPLEEALLETTDPDHRMRLELLQRNALRLQKLVNNLLDFSRIQAGRIQASYEPIDLAALTAELASVFRSAIERVGMRLIVDCPPLDALVYVDRDMYEKIVLNLLSNAFKFTLDGEITVRLREEDDAVELAISDTGAGIPDDHLPHIFERFHRIEGARARTHEGTGIGLALVRELVELHEGTVAVRSVYGQGSTFTVRLPKGHDHLPGDRIAAVDPLTRTSAVPAHYLEEALRWQQDLGVTVPPEPTAAEAPAPDLPATSVPRIVWADDNADMRDYVGRLLEPRYDLEVVADGEAALAAVRRRRPDLILTDVMMPRLDGFGLLRAVRADENLRSIPVILLSALAGEDNRVGGMEAGADDYLVKPFSARELVARVDAHIKLSRQRREAEQALRQVHAELRAEIAERRQAEEQRTRVERALRTSEENYRALFSSIDEGLAIVEVIRDAAGEAVDLLFVDVNPAFERQTGLAGVRGKLRSESVSTLDPSWLKAFDHVARTGESKRLEQYHRELGRWFRVYASQVGEAGSNEVAVVFEDITQRKSNERRQAFLLKLSDTLRPFSDALEIQRAATRVAGEFLQVDRALYYEFAPDGRDYFIADNYVRPGTTKRVGRFPSDVFSNMIDWLTQGKTLVIGDVRKTARMTEAETEISIASGILAVIGVPLVKGGRLVAQLGVQQREPRDWTPDEVVILQETAERTWAAVERARAEEALRHSEERLRTLADSVPQIIWTNSGDGLANYFNRRWYEYTGLDYGQSFGLGWEAVVHPDDAAAARRQWEQTLMAGEIFDCEYRLRGKDGSYRWFIGRNVPMKDADGQLKAWFGSATDIHELKLAQAALQEADQRKNNFLAMLGHELRNPLAAIRSGVGLLRSEKARPESRAAALPIVAEQVAHMERLVDDLLDLTRIVQGRVQVRRERMAVQDAVRQALEMVRSQQEAGGFVIDVRMPDAELEILGDRVRLTQVFMNVVDNAIKYSGDSRLIEVSAEREGDAALIRVRDYGLGIPLEVLPRIFEPFVQVKPGLTLQAGLGLGLAVVRQLVRLHDGDVEVFTRGERQGSEFVLRLPLLLSIH